MIQFEIKRLSAHADFTLLSIPDFSFNCSQNLISIFIKSCLLKTKNKKQKAKNKRIYSKEVFFSGHLYGELALISIPLMSSLSLSIKASK